MIRLESCKDTLDSFMLGEDDPDEWLAIHVIMQLIAYQKVAFTHNDLHTNNIMYMKQTNNIYCFESNYYVYLLMVKFGK